MAGGTTSTSTEFARTIEETPTWALAVVFFVTVAVSVILEQLIDFFGTWLKRRRKIALLEAVQKLKSELMVMGFMSLLLASTQGPIAKICISKKIAIRMLPCKNLHETVKFENFESAIWKPERLLADDDDDSGEDSDTDHCRSKGMVSMMSEVGIHQLHIFIFVMATTHVIWSALTMALGRAKMNSWKSWEKETQSTDYQVANDPNRFRILKQTSFSRRHTSSLAENSVHLWIKCFFRQFFGSVAKVDYLTLRHSFIATHLRTSTFNFQKYIERSLEDDFKVVIGITPALWIMVVIFLLINIHGWHIYLWISFIPPIIVLTLGAKLEIVLTRMAIKLQEQNTVVKGAPLVQPNDEFFWFGHPKFVLNFIHFTLFLCAFEIAFFAWTLSEFGLGSCYHENTKDIIIRLGLSVSVILLCSYITLPLYALVTQMGSQYKKSILEAQTANTLRQWHSDVKETRKVQLKKKKQAEAGASKKTPSIFSPSKYDEQEDGIDVGSPGQDSFTRHRHSLTFSEMVDISNRGETSNKGEITEEENVPIIDHRVK